jgi:5-bromo-4-chloroindolyl phosphate hydrolysis protein
MESGLKILAVILGGIAAFLWWTGRIEGAFVFGVGAAVSFFLGVRSGSKLRVDARNLEKIRDLEQLEEAKEPIVKIENQVSSQNTK